MQNSSKAILIKNANIVNEGKIYPADVLIENGKISKITKKHSPNQTIDHSAKGGSASGGQPSTIDYQLIDATDKYLFPGVIDDQVHFREPGLTHKADIYTESKAAVAGGITSFMEMPNTIPNVLTQQLLEEKYEIAARMSLANYSFYMGASNDNIDELLKVDPKNVCGVKVFMGSSTGNMLVDNRQALETIFSQCNMLIAVHCEDEKTIRANTVIYKEKYGEEIPIRYHPAIRSEKACYKSSSFAVELAKKHNTRLHILHLSTAKETGLFDNTTPLKDKRITAEACIHHLWFSDTDYEEKGAFIKWNPAIKTQKDKEGILKAVLDNKIDVIATDHSPHTIEEKQNTYFNCPSGGPMVQHALVAMLEIYHQRKITLEKIVEKMCHAPADCFRVEKRGYIREGYWADLVIADLNSPWMVDRSNNLSKCGWSPFDGQTFRSKITHTFVNGHLAYACPEKVGENGSFDESIKGQRILFKR